jgi:carbon monoxide dehydrogenase subunit G
MLKKILAVLAVAIVGVLGFAATRPDSFTVQRSALVKAPPAKLYPLISDLKAFNTWNPFAAQDPTSKITYAGATSGKGAAYTWQGSKSGEGRMELTDAQEGSKVTYKLDFTKPMEAHNVVEFSLVPQGDTTNVTWAMRGPMPFISKVMTLLFFDMDKTVGGEFEKGLASLKVLAER